MAPLDLEAIERELAGPMRPVGLHELAKAVGGLAFVEVSLFRQLGVLALGASRDGAGEWASGASMQAAWRRAQLESLLPLSVGLPCAGELVVPPGPATTEAMAQLSAHSAVAGSPSVGTEIHLAVLAVVRFVYPALAHSYSARQK
ncbi:MAG: hypothetical protein ACRDZ5_06205, partial [Acidimicrobiales bacterium]